MSQIVSVIIPCYNAARWIGAAIDSCLVQTYPSVEIIVIDDGSTDGSFEIVRGYGECVISERTANQGACAARNRGLALAQGKYVLYLDADDFILPDMLTVMVAALDATDGDVAYCDWRHLVHREGGGEQYLPVEATGPQTDIRNMILSGWWVPPCALLYSRRIVDKIGLWDTNLSSANDRDYFVRALLAGANFVYEPGCYAVYRRYGNVTLSTSKRDRWVKNHAVVLEKVYGHLQATDELDEKARKALAQSYYQIAHTAFDIDRPLHHHLLARVTELDSTFTPDKPAYYRWLQRVGGLQLAERAAGLKRRLLGQKAEF